MALIVIINGIQPTLPAIPGGSTPNVVFTNNNPDQYLLFNPRIIEGLSSFDLDITNVNEVFKHIFNRLPDEVIVYPSENYYYFVLYAEERQFWGNIRLPAGARDEGELSFAYFEFEEFYSSTNHPLNILVRKLIGNDMGHRKAG